MSAWLGLLRADLAVVSLTDCRLMIVGGARVRNSCWTCSHAASLVRGEIFSLG